MTGQRQPTNVFLSGRLVILTIGLVAIFTLLWARLVEVQLIRGREFTKLADDNRFYSETILADRGIILDRYQEPLVLNKRRYFELATTTSLHTQKTPISREQALQLMATESSKVSFTNDRWYPYSESTVSVLGYVGLVSAEDLEKNSSFALDEIVGKLGLERVLNDQLKGQRGQRTIEINALGQRQRLMSSKPAQSGLMIQTSIDPWLSQVAYRAFGNQRGAVVISDASSGAILALVSHPSYDPNILSTTPVDAVAVEQRNQQLQELFANPLQLFFNRVTGGVYPPGSIFKIITAIAGLRNDVLKIDTIVTDEGTLKVGDYEYRNWYFTQYGRTEGPLNVVRALARSNDIFFYKTAEWVGPEKIAATAREFGLGEAPQTELLSEAAGVVPDPEWKEKTLGERWYLGNTYHFGIGQDNLLVSPLQASEVIQTVANGGRRCRPTLLSTATPECWELGVTPEQWQTVTKGLLDACSPGGTAYPFFPRNQAARQPDASVNDDFQRGAVACKTGTAEFGGSDAQGYRKTHGWFVSVVEPQVSAATRESETAQQLPPTIPELVASAQRLDRSVWLKEIQEKGFPQRITITVMVESDETQPFKEGSRDAAPIAKAILDWIEQGKLPESVAPITPPAPGVGE